MKRGRRASTPVCDTLAQLMRHPCPAGFFPWQVTLLSQQPIYCFARTENDAKRKVMNTLTKATPCNVADIIDAAKKEEVR